MGDPTMHGGAIIIGFPTVLIGSMPAARILDMHVCPMTNVVVPHVGGPILKGSFTVLIGMFPAARMLDNAMCLGPPDMIAMGMPTVLIGG
ncbi:PAAR domain-containing protein [Candidatus Venteria ishoeyi]|nr:PAAR domain-containing protein [Candidatus Venteria ishoeyi]MDM8545666.1 PAAR domain-containing protein [Candidatus Venteria ishoeyi]